VAQFFLTHSVYRIERALLNTTAQATDVTHIYYHSFVSLPLTQRGYRLNKKQ